VVRVIAAFIIAMLVSIVIGPKVIEWLRGYATGHKIQEELLEHHHAKQETPIMGGLLIILTSTLAYLLVGKYTLAGLTVLGATIGCGFVGFLDDWLKVTHQRSLGLRGRWKLVLLVAITVGVGIAAHEMSFRHPTDVYLPGLDWSIPLSYGWYALLFFVVAGAANGVNLTDGLDGLAAGTGMIALLTFAAINVIAYIRSDTIVAERSQSALDLAILGAALVGGTIGFLWYNAFPADVFMGDTGSMAIGGALAGFAIMTKTEMLLLLIGGIFLIEALSVIAQVLSFKWTGKRIFLIAPIHHHFVMKAWSETKVMVRFWILAAILCAAGFALYYRYYLEFRR
jgi:phospho-N-acetylmuramoyl-pentapeptide-transferase